MGMACSGSVVDSGKVPDELRKLQRSRGPHGGQLAEWFPSKYFAFRPNCLFLGFLEGYFQRKLYLILLLFYFLVGTNPDYNDTRGSNL